MDTGQETEEAIRGSGNVVSEENAPKSVDGKDEKRESFGFGWIYGGVYESGEDATAQIPQSHVEKELSGEGCVFRKDRR